MRKRILTASFLSFVVLFNMVYLSRGVSAAYVQPAPATAYYQIVNNIIKMYGINTQGDFTESNGLTFADVIDFDKDGIPELYVVYFKGGKSDDYTQEIWSYKNNKAIKVFSDQYGQSGRVYDRAVTVFNTSKKSYIGFTSHFSTGTGTPPFDNVSYDTYSFLTLVNNKFMEVASAEYVWEQNPINGQTRESYFIKESNKKRKVSKKDYNHYLESYGYRNSRQVITSDVGAMGFGFDTSKNQKTILGFMQNLRSFMRPAALKNMYGQLNVNQKSQLTAFLFPFTDMGKFDGSKYTDLQIINFLKSGIHHGKFRGEKLSKDPVKKPIIKNGDFYYEPYSAAQVNQLTKKLFGVTIAPKNYVDEDGWEIARYKDGFFYILSPNTGSNPTVSSPQVDKLYSLGNGLYYAEFVIYTTTGFEPGFRNYLKSVDMWSSTEKSMSFDYRTGYALLKEVVVNGQKSWRLVRYSEDGTLLSEPFADF